MQVRLGSDYVKQTSGAGLFRTDFDRALGSLRSAISSGVSLFATSVVKMARDKYLGLSETFLRGYVGASEKLARPLASPASNDYLMNREINALTGLDKPDVTMLLSYLQQAKDSGGVPASMWSPAAYLAANPKVSASIYGAVKQVAKDTTSAVKRTVSNAASLVLDPVVDATKKAALIAMLVPLLGIAAAVLLLRKKK